jgi:hypothetical protein
MNKTQTIVLNDSVIQILYNKYLSSKPFLVRIYGWDDEPQEFRMNETEIQSMIQILDTTINNKSAES